jgi:hypothetical protein
MSACERICTLAPRHRSEQYFTSSQFLAHDLRHTIARPHATQSFDGSDALLPLKLKTIAAYGRSI